MIRAFAQATEPIADEYFRILRRLRGEIGTLTRQVESDALLSTDLLASEILASAQQGVDRKIRQLDSATTVEQLYAIEEDAIRIVRIAQRDLRERREELEAAPEPDLEPMPDDEPMVPEEPSFDPDPEPTPPTAKSPGFPWGWLVGGVGVGMATAVMVRRRRR